jgi:hypothetical protein
LIEQRLASTAVVFVVVDDAPPVPLLIDEEGMWKKPSLLASLTLAQILKYWAQLTPEQRTSYLEANFAELAHEPQVQALLKRAKLGGEDSVFDRFAGIFHAFHCLEVAVMEGLGAGNERDAESRLFGRQIDSLGFLLERVLAPDERHDDVDRYVMLLCARQVCLEVKRAHGEFWKVHRSDVDELEGMIASGASIRAGIVERGGVDMGEFLTWFDTWFLRRAKKTPTAPVEVPA